VSEGAQQQRREQKGSFVVLLRHLLYRSKSEGLTLMANLVTRSCRSKSII
jgi:hypothetical protein